MRTLRELMRRLERLEGLTLSPGDTITRIVRQIIGCQDGRPAPWNPAWAEMRRRREEDEEDRIERQPGEPVEAFEARAAVHFPSDYIIG